MTRPLSPAAPSGSPVQAAPRPAPTAFGRVFADAQDAPRRLTSPEPPGLLRLLSGVPAQRRLSPLLRGGDLRLAGGTPLMAPMARVARGSGLVPENLRLHRLHVGWQQEARSEGLLGALEQVLERSASLERWDRSRQETLREPRPADRCATFSGPPLPGPPPFDMAATEPRGRADLQASSAGGGPTQASGPAASPAPRSQQLLALVERIEACVREGRPALSLELAGTGWAVDLERHALGGVVLRLQTPPHGKAPDLEALRQELRARGVTLRELSCGPRPLSVTQAHRT